MYVQYTTHVLQAYFLVSILALNYCHFIHRSPIKKVVGDVPI